MASGRMCAPYARGDDPTISDTAAILGERFILLLLTFLFLLPPPPPPPPLGRPPPPLPLPNAAGLVVAIKVATITTHYKYLAGRPVPRGQSRHFAGHSKTTVVGRKVETTTEKNIMRGFFLSFLVFSGFLWLFSYSLSPPEAPSTLQM